MANSSYLKTPIAASINTFTDKKVNDGLQSIGKSLPCSVVAVNGALVTVKFEINSNFTLPMVTVPVATSFYVREPTQVGDKGMVISADTYLGGVSGQGNGVASLVQQGNLSSLVFQPLGNSSWAASPDSNAVLLQGTNGVILRDLNGDNTLTANPTTTTIKIGSATFTFSDSGLNISVGGTTIAINGSGITVSGGDVVANSVSLETHVHSGVQPGTGVSGPPVP